MAKDSASWSEGRNGQGISIEQQLQLLDVVDKILEKHSRDEDLQADLPHPMVQKALHHWTGRKRLNHEEAEQLTEDFRVRAVFNKMKELQSACRELGMGVPLEHLVARKAKLDQDLVQQNLGDAVAKARQERFKPKSSTGEVAVPTQQQIDETGDITAKQTWKTIATSFMMQALFMLLSMLLSMWFLELVYPMLQSSLESTDDATISIPEPPPEVDEF